MPVKIGMNSHTRRTKNRIGSRGQDREHEGRQIGHDQHRQRAHERHGDEQTEQRDDLDSRVDSLQQPLVRRGVFGEHAPRA